MANSEEFRNLLAQAVHRISACEASKPISVIHDELGHALGKAGAGSAIAYWRKGNLPQVRDLEKLAREIIDRCDLGKEWLKRFLISADYPYVENLCNELFPTTAIIDSPIDPAFQATQLPFTKSYRELTGRATLVTETLLVLSDLNARTIVAIDGVGGIGKTALAQEIVMACRKKNLFELIVWISGAKGNWHYTSRVNALTFSAVLNAIGDQLNLSDIAQLTEVEKEIRVHTLLRRHRILVVLDNLETAEEAQTEIIQRLQPHLGISKALLTSRHRFSDDLYAIHLEGLDSASAQQFLRQEANDRRIHFVENAQKTELERIVQVTGGSPLAMKLVVGQLGFLSLEIILTHLQAVKAVTRQNDTDEYVNLYKYIYFPSWALLSDSGKDLLVAMAPFVPGVGGTLLAIQAVSNMIEEDLPTYIHELWRLSFLEVGEVSQIGLAEKRYHLHPLTKHFVLSDIVNWGNV